MVEFYLDNDKVTVNPQDLIGEGGEAEVYRVGQLTAVKLFKQPTHPSYAGMTDQARLLRQAAEGRLRQMQFKLQEFPQGLPSEVVAPKILVFDRRRPTQSVIGYTMDYINDGQVLRQFTQRDFRDSNGITHADIADIFLSMHKTLTRVHNAGVVVGDFNVMNVLVADKRALLIDADSMQFGSYVCSSYMLRYLDPKNARLNGRTIEISSPHSEDSDWYAFACLLFECLTYVHPYGGVHRPQPGQPRLSAEERLVGRTTVFHPEVQYPQAALPLSCLPAPLEEYFQQVYKQDKRGEFPAALIELLAGKILIPTVSSHRTTAGGEQQAFGTPVFRTTGSILTVAWQNGKLLFLYHQDGKFHRENGACVLSGQISHQMLFRICGADTVVAKNNQVAVLSGSAKQKLSADSYRNLTPVVDTNGKSIFVVDGGSLCFYQDGKRRLIDDVLANQTRIWMGDKFGFGYYQAGQLRKAFLFEADGSGRINLPDHTVKGTPIEIRCCFSQSALWLFTSRNECGAIINSCTLIHRDGTVGTRLEAEESSDSWLATINGKCAASLTAGATTLNLLLSADTDAILQFQEEAGAIRLLKKIGAPGVLPSDNLLLSSNGLYVWNSQEIRLLSTRTPDCVAAGSQPAAMRGK